jgi:glycosyltransferase involved in cell wall biosynthesis
MKITFLTPGTGSYYCGACMRDNALANALIKDGHEAELLPMYLPLMLDEDSEGQESDSPVFFGGINIFLQQKFSMFRHSPEWFDKLLNKPNLLRSAAGRSHMTSARDHGQMTFEMLRLDGEAFEKELKKLYSWINDHGVPDALCLSTALQAGLAKEIKKQWDIPVICYFQGEDSFLDSLTDDYRDRCWQLMADRCQDADLLLAPSEFYARLMERRLGMDTGQIRLQINGINLEGFQARGTATDEPPAIGYLARMCEVKGLPLLVDAFIHLRKQLGNDSARLKIAGAMTKGDVALVESLKSKLDQAGLSDSVEWLPNISRGEKLEFLSGLSLFSVPVQYEEAFGLYGIEAMAASVPIAQPNASAFPEIIEKTGGGVCVDIEGPESLAEAWRDLLEDPQRLKIMGEQGRLGVERSYSMEAMKNAFLDVLKSLRQPQPSNDE